METTEWVPIDLGEFFLFLRKDSFELRFCCGTEKDTMHRVYRVTKFMSELRDGKVDIEKLAKESMEKYLTKPEEYWNEASIILKEEYWSAAEKTLKP